MLGVCSKGVEEIVVLQPRYPSYPHFNKKPSKIEATDRFVYREVVQEMETCSMGNLVMLKDVCCQWSLLIKELWTWGTVVISLPSVLYRAIFSGIVAFLWCGHHYFHWCKWEALDFVPYDQICFASAKFWLKSEIQLGSLSDSYNILSIGEEHPPAKILLFSCSLPSKTTGRALLKFTTGTQYEVFGYASGNTPVVKYSW